MTNSTPSRFVLDCMGGKAVLGLATRGRLTVALGWILWITTSLTEDLALDKERTHTVPHTPKARLRQSLARAQDQEIHQPRSKAS